MKVGLGVFIMILILVAFTEFTLWRECKASPSAYCRVMFR